VYLLDGIDGSMPYSLAFYNQNTKLKKIKENGLFDSKKLL